jgi:cytochrome c554/c'-like protein
MLLLAVCIVLAPGLSPVALAGNDLLEGDDVSAPQPAQPKQAAPAAKSGDDLLEGSDLSAPQQAPPEQAAPTQESAGVESEAAKEHAKLFVENKYPSAGVCQTCHPNQYREWAMSQHSYSQLSPTLQAFQGTLQKLENVTVGDFCIRCHNPVGMNLGEHFYVSSLERHPASFEGITCVVCHRVSEPYGRVNGRVRINEGPIFAPVKGPTGDAELNRVLSKKDEYHVATKPGQPGREIHGDVVEFERISTPAFCGTCHDVSFPNGFRVEDAYSEYRMSPAAARGITCQDCHMSTEPGKPVGYRIGPAAVVGGVPTRPRKLADHRFPGPDYSLVHPGLFPHNEKAREMATLQEWITFDWKAGWGTKEFEAHVPKDAKFPPRWRSVDDRMDARAIIEENQASLREIAEARRNILRIGFVLDQVVVDRADKSGIRLRVKVRNGIDAHDVPTGFDSERVVFLHVTVRDAHNKLVFESGDQDPNGDLRDQHSLYVRNGELPIDPQLFTLDSKFLIDMIRGGEREQLANVNLSFDALPFLRPEGRPTILFGHPKGFRKFRKSLPPLAERWASYTISPDQIAGSTPPYMAHVELVMGMLAPALVSEVQAVGFDFNMSPRAVGDALLAGYQVLWQQDIPIAMQP